MSTELHCIDENRKMLSRYLFSDKFCMSCDLQLLILDYVFARSVTEFDRETFDDQNTKERCWIRLGVVFSEDTKLSKTYLSLDYKRLFYEIRVYTEKKGHVLSTCDVYNEDYIINNFEAYRKYFTLSPTAKPLMVAIREGMLPERHYRFSYSINENCLYKVVGDATGISVAEDKGITFDTIWKAAYSSKDSRTVGEVITDICQLIHQRGTDNVLKRLKKVYYD